MHLENSLHTLRFIILFLLCCFLVLICTIIQIDNFDAYNLLLNAKAIAKNGGSYSIYRSIVASLFYTPAFLIEKHFEIPYLGFRIAHLMNAGLFMALLGILYRLYRLSLSRTEAFASLFALALTPIVIHYVPIAKEDFPASFFLVSAFYFYLKSVQIPKLKFFLPAGCFTTLAMGARYNLIPVLFSIFFCHEIWLFIQTKSLKNWKSKLGLLYLLPVALWLLLPMAVYPIIGHGSGLKATVQFIRELFEQYNSNQHVYRAPIYNYLFFIKAISWPILMTAIFGMVSALKERKTQAPFFLIWFIFFFLFQTYFVSGKEVRYLFPCFPPVFYFFICGIGSIRQLSISRRTTLPLLFGLSILWPSYRALVECNKFRDRFYTTAFQKEVSLEAKKLSGAQNSLIWVGHYYGTHPKDYIFDKNEDFTYLYHFYVNAILFYTEKSPLTLSGGPPLIPNDWQSRGVWLPGIGKQIKSGDVFLINLEKTVSRTSIIPNPLPPLIMQQAEKFFLNSNHPPALGQRYELYVEDKHGLNSRGFVDLNSLTDFTQLKHQFPSTSYLLTFKNVKLFHPPRS